MKLQVLAVGRLRKGPEKALVDDYLTRFAKTGRSLGLPPVSITELDAKGGPDAESEALLRAMIPRSEFVVMDERGKALTSIDFAERLGAWRDDARDVSLVIGGADGLAMALRDRADLAISFGAMVWPHMLVRVMLAEQLYRAATILAGTPYHRA